MASTLKMLYATNAATKGVRREKKLNVKIKNYNNNYNYNQAKATLKWSKVCCYC